MVLTIRSGKSAYNCLARKRREPFPRNHPRCNYRNMEDEDHEIHFNLDFGSWSWAIGR